MWLNFTSYLRKLILRYGDIKPKSPRLHIHRIYAQTEQNGNQVDRRVHSSLISNVLSIIDLARGFLISEAVQTSLQGLNFIEFAPGQRKPIIWLVEESNKHYPGSIYYVFSINDVAELYLTSERVKPKLW